MKILKSLLRLVGVFILSAIPAMAQAITPDTTKTITDFNGSWTGVSCFDATHSRYEQLVVSEGTDGGPQAVFTFLANDGTTPSMSATIITVQNGELQVGFKADDTHGLALGLVYPKDEGADNIIGYLAYVYGDEKSVGVTVLQKGAFDLTVYAQQHSDVCSALNTK